jgi:hypothetical protein
MVEPASDAMPKMSYSQEKMAYIPPAEGTIPTRHRNTKAGPAPNVSPTHVFYRSRTTRALPNSFPHSLFAHTHRSLVSTITLS